MISSLGLTDKIRGHDDLPLARRLTMLRSRLLESMLVILASLELQGKALWLEVTSLQGEK